MTEPDLTTLEADDVYVLRLVADDPPREPDIMRIRRAVIEYERDVIARWTPRPMETR
jgi:hypothetical protein